MESLYITEGDVDTFVASYFDQEGYSFPTEFEHRVDEESSKVMYALIRHFKPKVALSCGTWFGGSACLIMSALLKNGMPFEYYTAEILPDKREATLQNVFKKCGRTPVMVGDITKSLEYIPKQIDFLFHDTDHDEETIKWVVENIFPRIKKGALVAFHDWAVYEKDGQWLGKGKDGIGGWPETEYLLKLKRDGKFPFKKLYWNYREPGFHELGCFTKI